MSADTVSVIGVGYVGLPAAVLLAASGCPVIGVDSNAARVGLINSGTFDFGEPELNAMMALPAVKANLQLATAPRPSDIFVIAVPTPLDKRKKTADLSELEAALYSLLPVLAQGNLVIVESTIPPLTCRELVTPILESSGLKVGESILLAHCPERILPGNVLYEIVHNDRVIGGTTPAAAERAMTLYGRFVLGDLLITDDVTAEMVKLLENTYRDVNIALANEIAAVAEVLGIDPIRMIDLANHHPRVNLLRPGIGVGGHCIPIDPWFIKQVDPAHSRLIFAARLINDEQPHQVAAKIRRAVRGASDPRIVAIGTTYKPDVPDVRESPANDIVELLREDGYQVDQYDPLVGPKRYESLAQAARGADCLAILVEHATVRRDLAENESEILAGMRTPLLMRFYVSDADQTPA